MASLMSNLSSTVSRLTLLRNPSIHFSTKTLQKLHLHPRLSRPVAPFLHHTTDFVSAHYSSCLKARAIEASGQDEELVVLGIETSCDDTAAAVVRSNGEILSEVVSSQADLLVRYGGVAPKMAEEAHSLVIDQVVQEALDKAKVTEEDLSAVAVTIGPGLSLCLRGNLLRLLLPLPFFLLYAPPPPPLSSFSIITMLVAVKKCTVVISRFSPNLDLIYIDLQILVKLLYRLDRPLLRQLFWSYLGHCPEKGSYNLCIAFSTVGVRKARKLAGVYALPIIGVHHMEAHALVARLVQSELQFPFMALLISGGHNLIVLARDLGHYIQLGTTIDDAIGEAYDKTAKWLGLDMRKSGGPAVEELAREGDEISIKFKVPMKQHKDCNFSYAGLKTQVRLAIESKNIDAAIPVASASEEDRRARADIAASFQRVAVLHLEEKCERAIEWALKIEPSMKYLVASGGVASNQYVRSRLNTIVEKKGLQLVCPPPSLCTDNGVMIAWTGIEHFRMGRYDPPPPACEPEDALLDLRPRWPLGEELAEGRSEARSMRTARIHPSLTSLIQASIQQPL